MKKFIFIYLVSFLQLSSQIKLITTNTSESIWALTQIKSKIIINSNRNYLAKSYDGGETFTPINPPFPIPYNFQFQMEVIDSSVYIMASFNNNDGKYYIHKTIDGGNTWVKKQDTINPISYIKFFDSNEGLISSGTYQLYKTQNAGATNSLIPFPLLVTTMMSKYSDSIICIGGGSTSGLGDFIISKDRGLSWYTMGTSGAENRDFFCLTKDTMIVLSSNTNDTFWDITYNGGKNYAFTSSKLPINNGYSMYFKTKNEGYVIGSNTNNQGVIIKTTDLGKNWSTFNTGITTKLLDMIFLNDSIALVSGTNGVLFKWNSKTSIFTGVKENSSEILGYFIYPNPTNDKIHFMPKITLSNVKLNVINLLGQEVYSQNDFDLKNELDIGFLPKGIYYLKLVNENDQKTFKILKE